MFFKTPVLMNFTKFFRAPLVMNTFRRLLLILLAKLEHLKDRSSLPEVFCKEGVIKYFAKFLRKHLCQNLFFEKVEALTVQLDWKRNCATGVFVLFLQNF